MSKKHILLIVVLLAAGAAGLFLLRPAENMELRPQAWGQVVDGLARYLDRRYAGSTVTLALSEAAYTVDRPLEVPDFLRVELTNGSGRPVTLTRAEGYQGAFINSKGSVKISGDITLEGGGAADALIRVQGGSADLTGLTLTGNQVSGGRGGGLAIEEGAVQATLTDCAITACQAQYGGGLYCAGRETTLSLNRCRVEGCSSTASGGGLYAYGQLRLTDCVICGNTARTYGGGVMVKTHLEMEGGELTGNRVTKGPGGGLRADGGVRLKGVRVTGNSASTRGGGLDVDVIQFECEDCLVADNTAPKAADTYPESWQNVDWKTGADLTPIQLTKRLTIERSGTLQGMTLTDRYLVYLTISSDETKQGLHVYDLQTLEQVAFWPGLSFRHGNDLTWNPTTGELVICNVTTRKDTERAIALLPLSPEGVPGEPVYLNADHAYGGICRDDATGTYYARSLDRIYTLSPVFQELGSFAFETPLTRQGLGYSDGLIYVEAWERGCLADTQEVYNPRERDSNLLYLYTPDGTLRQTLYLPNTILPAELEGCSFDAQGVMWAMLQDDDCFYVCTWESEQ